MLWIKSTYAWSEVYLGVPLGAFGGGPGRSEGYSRILSREARAQLVIRRGALAGLTSFSIC